MLRVGDQVLYQTEKMLEPKLRRIVELHRRERYLIVDDRGWDQVVLLDVHWIRRPDGTPIEEETTTMAPETTQTATTPPAATAAPKPHLAREKVCRKCGATYAPTSNSQFFCPTCGEARAKAKAAAYRAAHAKSATPKAPPRPQVAMLPPALPPIPDKPRGLVDELRTLVSAAQTVLAALEGRA